MPAAGGHSGDTDSRESPIDGPEGDDPTADSEGGRTGSNGNRWLPGTGTGSGRARRASGVRGGRDSRSVDPLGAGWVGDLGPVGRRLFVLVLVVTLFALAFGVGRAVVRLVELTVGVGEPGTVSRLLAGVAGLQVAGFGIGLALVTADRAEPLSYLRVGGFDQWTALYGTAVGMTLMLVASAVTVAFRVLGVEPAESATGAATDPLFYLVLFVVSTAVAAPMEELFFRGIVQRSLETVWHPAVAIGVTSLLFVTVHTSVTVGTGGEALVFAMFLAFGVVLGVGYHLTGNLLVPVVGHIVFNGAQTLTQAVEVAVS